MWPETIAVRRTLRQTSGLPGRVLTGPAAFGVAGVIDVAAVLWALIRLRLDDRSDRLLREGLERRLGGE